MLGIAVGFVNRTRKTALTTALIVLSSTGLAAQGTPALEVEAITLAGTATGQELTIVTSVAPELVSSQLDRDGVLVLELPGYRAKETLTGITTQTGLVSTVAVGMLEDAGLPATRLLVRTRVAARYSVALDAERVLVTMWPAEAVSPVERAFDEEKIARRLEELEARRSTVLAGLAEARRELSLLEEERADREAALASANQTARTLSADLEQAEALAAELLATRSQLESDLADSRGAVASLESTLAANRDSGSVIEAELAAARQAAEALTTELERERQSTAALEAELESLRSEVAGESSTRSSLESELAAARDAATVAAGERDQARAATAELERAAAAASQTRAALAEQMESLRTERAELIEEAGARDQTIARLEAELTGAASEGARLGEELAALMQRTGELEDRLAGRSEELSQTRAQLAEAREEIDRYRAEGAVQAMTTDSVNLRSGPGTEHDRLETLPADTITEVLTRGDDWTRVRVGDRAGWVASEFLRSEADEVEELRREVRSLEETLTGSHQSTAALENELRAERAAGADLQSQLTTANETREALEAEVAGARQTLTALRAQIESLAAERTSLIDESTGAADARESLATELEAATAAHAALLAQVESLAAERERLIAEAASAEMARETLAGQLSEARGELATAKEELDRYRQEGLVQALTTDSVNLRAGPGTQHDRLDTLPADTVVEVVTRGDGWTRVRSGDRIGWLASEFLKVEGDEVSELRRRVSDLDTDLATAADAQKALTERVRNLTEERKSLLSKSAARDAKMNDLTAELERFRTASEALEAELAGARAEIDRYRLQGVVNALTTESVNLREGPGTEHRRLETLPADTVTEVLTRGETWTRVQVGGRIGWLASEYLRPQDDEVAQLRTRLATLQSRLEADASRAAELERELGAARAASTSLGERLEAALAEIESYRTRGVVRATTTDRVNLRAGPGTEHPRLAGVPAGAVIAVVARGARWTRVSVGNREGWISNDFLTLEDDLVAQLRGRLGALEAELAAARERETAAAQSSSELTATVESARAESESLRAENRSLTQLLAESRDLEGSTSLRLDEALATVATLETRLAETAATTSATAELQALEERLGSELHAAREAEAAAHSRVRQLEAESAAAKAVETELAARVAKLQRSLEAAEIERRQLVDESTRLRSELTALQSRPAAVAPTGPCGPSAASGDPAGPLSAVQAWAGAWSTRDVDAYLSFYAPDFEPPGGMDRPRWEAQRRDRITRPSRISVELSEMEVCFAEGGGATAEFVQTYESERYSDRVRKVLELERDGEAWRILRERVDD